MIPYYSNKKGRFFLPQDVHDRERGAICLDIHTRQLRYFMELAQCLNFTKAAMNLYIAQPALSQQIADLEKQLGVTLFERSSRSVTLTPAGKILQSACPEIFSKLDSVEQQVLRAQAGLRGSIKIGYIDAFQPILPRIMLKFRQLYPDIAQEFYYGTLKELKLALENGDIDVAFAWINPPAFPQNHIPDHMALWQEDLCIAVHQEHPFARSGGTDYTLLENEPFIMIDDSTSPGFQSMAQEAAREVGFTIRNQTVTRQFATIVMQVEAGMGASILPSRTCSFTFCPADHIVFYPIKKDCLDFGAVWYGDSKNATLPLFLDSLEKTVGAFSEKEKSGS